MFEGSAKTRLRKVVLFSLIILVLLGFNLLISFFALQYINNHQLVSAQLFANTQRILEDNLHQLVLGESTEMVYTDARVKSLEQFFAKYDSPLLPYAEKIVKVADTYGFYYGLLPSIAMVESGLCKKIPENSYNCWGWGIYGKTVTRFISYDEAIDVVAKGIKLNYIDKGYDTPELIMTKYNPNNHNNWLGGVNLFLESLE